MQNNDPNDQYTYTQAGFNRFFRRSFGTSPVATDLNTMAKAGGNRQLKFDQQQVSGPLGDALAVGRIKIDGKTGRISVMDERGNEVLRLGDLGSD